MRDDNSARRTFLKSATVLGSGVLIAGCTGDGPKDSGDTNNNQENNDDPTATATETEESSTSHEMGETFSVGEGEKMMQYTVKKSEFAEKLSSEYSEYEPSGVFLVVTISYKNVGSETIDLTTRAFKALSPEKNEYDVHRDTQFALDDTISIEQVNPELGGEGQLIFDVPTGKDSWRIMFKPAGIFSGAEPHTVTLDV